MKRIFAAVVFLLVSLSLCTQIFAASGELVYTDKDTGVTFNAPAGWVSQSAEEGISDKELLDVEFSTTKEKGAWMAYGSIDLWETMPYADKKGYSREDLSFSEFTDEEIKELSGRPGKGSEIVTYNGRKYCKTSLVEMAEISGEEVATREIRLVHITDGWLYNFQFFGIKESELYADFESMVKSAQYPASIAEKSTLAQSKLTITAFFVAILVCIAIVLIRKKLPKKKYKVQENEWGTCKSCGEVLPKGSTICYRCGSRSDIGQ